MYVYMYVGMITLYYIQYVHTCLKLQGEQFAGMKVYGKQCQDVEFASMEVHTCTYMYVRTCIRSTFFTVN